MKSLVTETAAQPRPQKPKSNSPFTMHQGRRYIADESVVYPLPNDVKELSRQALVHEMTCELVGGLHFSDIPHDKIPRRVLDIGCGTAIWCASMSDEFARRGCPGVEFVGVDLVPVYTDMKGVNFKYVQSDITKEPLPFPDGSFDMVVSRDLALAIPATAMFSDITSEIERVLKPGGIFEIFAYDCTMRALQRTQTLYEPRTSAYPISSATHFSTSENPYIVQYNDRMTALLTHLNIPSAPCTQIAPAILMLETLTLTAQKRIAIPLDEIWWESPGASDTSSVSSARSTDSSHRKGSFAIPPSQQRHRSSTTTSSTSGLTDNERAVRALAKLVWIQSIDSLEPRLREVNKIDLDEWERWYRDLMWNTMENQGLRNGECIEFGAFWGRKDDCPKDNGTVCLKYSSGTSN
ncbi:hypothetical protein EDC01DRAFT_612616 [Geopyxis carbonaria]|nr:hypothetical protein EDC01DRAFT_612616 [Geopyxis carbonaria]